MSFKYEKLFTPVKIGCLLYTSNEYLLLGTVGVTMTSSEPGTTTGGLMTVSYTHLAIEIDCSFTPIDLNRISRIELKWYKCKRRLTADFMDSTSDCRFAAFETFFFNEAIKNSSCGMSLFLQAFCFIFFEA